MARITFRAGDGSERVLDIDDGTSVMQGAVAGGVPGIVGECGGSAMCATCHVYVDEAATAVLPAVSEDEDEMLDCAVAPRTAASRLSCQLIAGPAIDGLVVHVPARQR